MAKFVKSIGINNFYEIDNFRAAGILPYYINNNQVYILINKEYRLNDLLHNLIGGKVDKNDILIEDTMIREFNEETGFLLNDKIIKYKKNLLNNKIHIVKSKYLLSLIDIENDNDWKNLHNLYNKIFYDQDIKNDRDSIELKWINLFEFEVNNISYLLNTILDKLKKHELFLKYNKKKNNNLFID